MSKVDRACDNCGKPYKADTRNLKRGWGLCCTKRCAAQKREKDKPGYNPARVAANNIKRERGFFNPRTSEGYRVIDGIAVDESDNPVYNVEEWDDPGDEFYWDRK